MIGPKAPRPTAADERKAYLVATLRDADRCQRCLRDCGPLARDHRKNRSQGGPTSPANLQCLGLGCHDWKTSNPAEANRTGWGAPAWADPAEYPAARWLPTNVGTVRQSWVLYRNETGPDGAWWVEISVDEALERIAGIGR